MEPGTKTTGKTKAPLHRENPNISRGPEGNIFPRLSCSFSKAPCFRQSLFLNLCSREIWRCDSSRSQIVSFFKQPQCRPSPGHLCALPPFARSPTAPTALLPPLTRRPLTTCASTATPRLSSRVSLASRERMYFQDILSLHSRWHIAERGRRFANSDVSDSTPNRPLTTVRFHPTTAIAKRRRLRSSILIMFRNQGCRWHQPQEGRHNPSRLARLQECL